MKLENLSVVIRPRSPWEACDLGVLMARNCFWPMFKASLVLSFPFFVAVNALLYFSPEYLWAATVIIWWSKPIWERIHLSILSSAVFAEIPKLTSTIRTFRKLFHRQLIQSLIWRRLSLSRAFTMPVMQLEGLGGSARRKRIENLVGGDRSTIRWTTIIGVHIESFLLFAAYILVLLLVPSELFEGFWTLYDGIDANLTSILDNLIYYLVMLLVMPFYIAAGFALYLNRRAILEGWDIEIAFKHLASRAEARRDSNSIATGSAKAVASTILVFSLLLTTGIEQVRAQGSFPSPQYGNPEESKVLISEVLAGDEFHVVEEYRVPDVDWDSIFDFELSDNWFFRWLRDIFDSDRQVDFSFIEVILWTLVIALILLVLVRYRQWLGDSSYQRGHEEGGGDSQIPLFLGAAAKEQLPKNIPTTANQLWSDGDFRAALALLYRGFLHHILIQYPIPIRSSSTEGECVSLVKTHTNEHTAGYFHSLSRTWQRLAYGHMVPDATKFDALLNDWQAAINAPTNAPANGSVE